MRGHAHQAKGALDRVLAVCLQDYRVLAVRRPGGVGGRRAASPARGPQAEPLVNQVIRALRDLGANVETGKFGADMRISAVCDGPMTVTIEV